MPRRDPNTGQFVAGSGSYDDVEVASFTTQVGIQAADLSGATGFTGGDNYELDGLELIDYDDVVDRNESLDLLEAHHAVTVFVNSTQTTDGTLMAEVEVSSSPSKSVIGGVNAPALEDTPWVGSNDFSDSIDLVGRPMVGVAHAPFSDSATGMSGSGTAGKDEATLYEPPSEVGQFHPRDELFANMSLAAWDIDNAGAHVLIEGQHIYGVRSD